MARYIAKNIVAAGLADAVRSAALLRHRLSRSAQHLGQHQRHRGQRRDRRAAGGADPQALQADAAGIIETLNLRRPIYRETARHGHFGRELPSFTWERTDKADALRKEVGVAAVV